MAKPRVFISSTFYDLKQIRLELDKFIEMMGYEPIRNEEGDIPYGSKEQLQEYCYKEISNVDILISIIGGRFGTPIDGDKNYSISNMELKTAIEEGKHVFIFIQKNVFVEYETYLLNKERDDILYKYVDNSKIYSFIEELKSLPKNNNIKDFETADNITKYLKEQFAGMMRQFFVDEEKFKETSIIKDITTTASTLKTLVDYISSTNAQKDDKMQFIISSTHPIISAIKKIIGIQYKFFIENKNDLDSLFKAYGYSEVGNPFLDYYQYTNNRMEKDKSIIVSRQIFDDEGSLKHISNENWKNEWITVENNEPKNDLPF